MAVAALPEHTYRHSAPRPADEQQAEYFRELLVQTRQEVVQRIGSHRSAIATAQGRGDVTEASRFRSLLHVDEAERQLLDEMIDGLHRRFPRQGRGEAFPISRRARSVVR